MSNYHLKLAIGASKLPGGRETLRKRRSFRIDTLGGVPRIWRPLAAVSRPSFRNQPDGDHAAGNGRKTKMAGLATKLATSVLALAAMMPAAFAQSKEPIKIGAVLSVTGAAAGLGVPERNGLQIAEKAINAKGGVKGRPI